MFLLLKNIYWQWFLQRLGIYIDREDTVHGDDDNAHTNDNNNDGNDNNNDDNDNDNDGNDNNNDGNDNDHDGSDNNNDGNDNDEVVDELPEHGPGLKTVWFDELLPTPVRHTLQVQYLQYPYRWCQVAKMTAKLFKRRPNNIWIGKKHFIFSDD